MVQQTDIEFISSTTTLSDNYDLYVVNAAAGGFTITLPPIASDGMNFRLNRQDMSSNIVTVEADVGNSIIWNLGITGTTGSATTGDINLSPTTSIVIQAFEDNWYVTAIGSSYSITENIYLNSGGDLITNQWIGIGFQTALEITGEILMPRQGYISEIFVYLQNAPGVGESRTFTINKNGVAEISVVINGTDTTGEDTSNPISVNAFDRISVKHVSSLLPAISVGLVTLIFKT